MAGKFAKLGHLVTQSVKQTLWETLDLRWTLPSGVMVKIRNFSEWVMYNDIFVDGEYAPAVDKLLTVEGNALVVDIGGNVGLFGMYAMDRWARANKNAPLKIIGVEGTPDTYKELQRRLDQTAVKKCADVQYHFGLAGKRSGEAFMSTSNFHGMNSIMGERNRFGQNVPFLDLDTVIPAGERIALLKCDIEGAEELFLENYPELLKRVDVVSMELHHDKCNVARCIALLNDAGLTKHTRLRNCLPEFTVDLFER